MGNIGSRLTRPLRTFNIESRTDKFLERDKPTVAPTFTSVEKQRELAMKLNPNFMETHNKRDAVLGDRLKEVFVTSKDPVDPNKESTKSMPKSREQFKITEYGVYEPSVVTRGRCTIRQAVTFLHDHKVDPDKNTADSIAKYLNMDKEVVENIVHHYRIFYMQRQITGSEADDEQEAPLLIKEFMDLTSRKTAESVGRAREIEREANKRHK